MGREQASGPVFPARPFKSIFLQNVLSFGHEGVEVELKPLNILIGPNAAGKSNLIEAIGLLSAAPRDWGSVISSGGGISEWLWKGQGASGHATIKAVIAFPGRQVPLCYSLSFGEKGQHFERREEKLEDAGIDTVGAFAGTAPGLYFRASATDGVVDVWDSTVNERRPLGGIKDIFAEAQKGSVLKMVRDPSRYPELTYVGRLFEEIRFYRDWNLGRHANIRRPQRSDLPSDFLLEDASNLALVLNELGYSDRKQGLDNQLRKLYDHAEGFRVRVIGGTVQVYMIEKGVENPVPPERLSDGTLRYLCLIAILCHPQPPPLICIDEPELGLHPDAISSVAEMLVDASSRCQLIVTTHSPELIDALSGTPESVVVCERTDAGTQMNRLDPKPLKKWIDEYRLGGAWKTGVIGGRL